MATSNFGRPNASYYYTFAMDCDDQELFDFAIQDVIEAVKLDLFHTDLLYIKEYMNETSDNCFAIKQFMVKSKLYDDDYLDEVQLRVVVKYGYYDGAILDWDLSHDPSELPKGALRKINSAIKKVEKIFAKHTTPMVRVGGFSDGTSLYEKVK